MLMLLQNLSYFNCGYTHTVQILHSYSITSIILWQCLPFIFLFVNSLLPFRFREISKSNVVSSILRYSFYIILHKKNTHQCFMVWYSYYFHDIISCMIRLYFSNSFHFIPGSYPHIYNVNWRPTGLWKAAKRLTMCVTTAITLHMKLTLLL